MRFSTDSESPGGVRYRVLVACAAIVLLTTAAAGARAGVAPELRVALTPPIATPALRSSKVPSCLPIDGASSQCARVVRGNDYQVLQWLLSARVDAAVISGLTWTMLENSGDWDLHTRFRVAIDSELATLPAYHVVLQAQAGGRALPDARAGLDAFLESLLSGVAADASVPRQVILPSHLSPALPWFVEGVRRWLAQRSPEPEAVDRFWRTLLTRLRFAIDGETPAADVPFLRVTTEPECTGSRMLCLTETPLRDLLVVRAPVPGAAENPRSVDGDGMDLYRQWFGLGQAGTVAPYPEPLRKFIDQNYQPVAVGPRLRYRFLFTLDELWPVLQRTGAAGNDGGLALVLTGGGVKAAYQTALVDDLYGQGWLVNDAAGGRPESGPAVLPVKFVIGTSGGALLGAFVAARGHRAKVDFSPQLWYRHDAAEPRLLDSTDVFPWMDLMRWLSFLACVFVFASAAALRSLVRRLRGLDGTTEPQVAHAAPVLRWARLFVWTVLLALTPFLIRFTNGEAAAAEHIPEIQGIFYFLCALIAIYSDARLRSLVPVTMPSVPALVWPTVMLAAGIAAVVASVVQAGNAGSALDLVQPLAWAGYEQAKVTVPALVACTGMLAVFFAVHRIIDPTRGSDALIAHATIGRGFLLLVLVVVATNLLHWVAVAAGWSTWSEFSRRFWVLQVALALTVSFALFWFAYGRKVPAMLQAWVKPGMDFLLSLHPSRLLLFRQRHWRIVLFFAVAWGWWNAVMAPAVYGNHAAAAYFSDVFQRMAKNLGTPCAGGEGVDDRCLRLQTYFVAPVTALARGAERYVLFQPEHGYRLAEAGQRELLGYQAWSALTYDPRWVMMREEAEQDRLLKSIVFASGSPFPIFPAHWIEMRRGSPEALVDGGYAHNIPVEAAKQLGAGRVLVLSSSPRDAPATQEPGWWSRIPGNLLGQVGRLLPYLYERSQIEDVLSAKDLLVVHVAPADDPEGWPFLMDFRAPVIERMLAAARRDRHARIADVESWGAPE